MRELAKSYFQSLSRLSRVASKPSPHHRGMAGEMPDADGKPRSASSGFQPSAPPQPQAQQYQYGTFGAPSSAPGEVPQPAVGFPQPAPPPGLRHYPQPPPPSYAVYPPLPPQTYPAAAPYYAQGYQAVQGTGNPSPAISIMCDTLGSPFRTMDALSMRTWKHF